MLRSHPRDTHTKRSPGAHSHVARRVRVCASRLAQATSRRCFLCLAGLSLAGPELRHDLVALIAGYSYLITGFVGPCRGSVPGPLYARAKMRVHSYGKNGVDAARRGGRLAAKSTHKATRRFSSRIARERREDRPIGAAPPQRSVPLAGPFRPISIGTEISIGDIEISCTYIARQRKAAISRSDFTSRALND